MNADQNNKLIVLVERHLALEGQLANALEQLNQAVAGVLVDAGLRGPTQQDVQSLEPVNADLKQSASEVAAARKVLLTRINLESESDFGNIKEFISSLPLSDRRRVDKDRRSVLERSTKAKAGLIHNQASLYYTFDFHRRYLAGVLQGDSDAQNYRADGQPNDLKSGNIIRKTC